MDHSRLFFRYYRRLLYHCIFPRTLDFRNCPGFCSLPQVSCNFTDFTPNYLLQP